jgi:hypothetical protein
MNGGGCAPPSGTQDDQEDVVLLPTLDSSKSFVFYAVNQSGLCAWLIPPDSASLTMAGHDEETRIPLTLNKDPLYAAGAPVFQGTGVK